jgi:hypothetical protein
MVNSELSLEEFLEEMLREFNRKFDLHRRRTDRLQRELNLLKKDMKKVVEAQRRGTRFSPSKAVMKLLRGKG